MCEAPLTVWVGKGANAREVQTACHECKQCTVRAVLDWVGRNIAESKTAVACHAVTLTYGRDQRMGSVDHLRSAILTYSDVQKWLKLLRRHGYPVRYFVTGEYGGTNGRAHWHVMLYWLERVPQLQLDKQCVDQNYWSHGFSFYTEPTYFQIWYNCKYILKDQKLGEGEQRVQPRMSKLPPLGSVYFAQLAEAQALQGLAPQTLEYSFSEVRARDGQHFVFRLSGVSATNYLEAYLSAWKRLRGDARRPKSQLVDDYEEWGRVVNPDTFDYRPSAVCSGRLLQLERDARLRGPVTDAEKEAKVAQVRQYAVRKRVERPGERSLVLDLEQAIQELGLTWQKATTSAEGAPMQSPRWWLTP